MSKWMCRRCVTALWPAGTEEKTIGFVLADRTCAVCDGVLKHDTAVCVIPRAPQPVYVSIRSLDGTEWHLSEAAALLSPTKLLKDVDGGPMVIAEVFTESSWEDALEHKLRNMEAHRSLQEDDATAT